MTAPVVVIGGGFAGALTALHLARAGQAVQLIEPRRRVGPGLAHASAPAGVRLNVIAARMSALADEPDDFARYLASVGDPTPPDGFALRARYGDYVAALMAPAIADGRIAHAATTATDVVPSGAGLTVRRADGAAVDARAVVLALGNASPRPLRATGDRARIVDDPWQQLARLTPAPDDDVLLIGTGLTSADVITVLRRGGHRGRITCVSRRGLPPTSHDGVSCAFNAAPALPVPDELRRRPTALGLLRWLRPYGVPGVGALRCDTTSLWTAMSLVERRRFLRHVRPYWDVVRHRVPPVVAAELAAGRAEGWLTMQAARLGAIVGGADGVDVTLTQRGRTTTTRVGWVVNCTGPDRDLHRMTDPLVATLLRRGLVTPCPLGLGARTAPDGALLDGAGAPIPGLYTLGPWRIGDLWESIAVPELRLQAAALAATLRR